MDLLKYRLETFGCKVNTYDSGLLQRRLTESGFQSEQNSHIYLLNTCAVTREATREAQRRVRQIKARDPLGLVVVTGCGAQVDTEVFAEMSGVDLVVANSHKGRIAEIIQNFYSGKSRERVHKSNIFKKDDLEAGGGLEDAHTRAFVKIQDGCDSFCTFCVIPFARGKSRSLKVEELVARVQELQAQGLREVVLTGVHIGDYLDDSGPVAKGLEDLVESLLLKTKMSRFRLSSLEPIELSDRLLELYQDERLCSHFHMSIQSANTKVLSDMKRRYSAREVERALQRIDQRVPEAFVGMDVIAGFPGETAQEFDDSYQRLSQLPWTRLHVFPYSARPGTFAARRTDPVSAAEISRRSAALRELSGERFAMQAMQQVGRRKRVLILKSETASGQGLSRDFWTVQIGQSKLPRGQEIEVNIMGYDHSQQSRMNGHLVAELA